VKIDIKSPVTGASVGETRVRSANKTPAAPQADKVSDVQLSGASSELRSSGETSTFDSAKVSEIKQAISDGRFKINAGAIADRLVSSAREILDSQRRA
jgi:negative regulator of flagellin synthesis FlgM